MRGNKGIDTYFAFASVLAASVYAGVTHVPWDAYVVLAVGMMALGYVVAMRRRH